MWEVKDLLSGAFLCGANWVWTRCHFNSNRSGPGLTGGCCPCTGFYYRQNHCAATFVTSIFPPRLLQIWKRTPCLEGKENLREVWSATGYKLNILYRIVWGVFDVSVGGGPELLDTIWVGVTTKVCLLDSYTYQLWQWAGGLTEWVNRSYGGITAYQHFEALPVGPLLDMGTLIF